MVVLKCNRLAKVFETLARLSALPDRVYLLVVDKGSTYCTPEHIAVGFPEITLITAQKKLGLAGRNLASRAQAPSTSRSAMTILGGIRVPIRMRSHSSTRHPCRCPEPRVMLGEAGETDTLRSRMLARNAAQVTWMRLSRREALCSTLRARACRAAKVFSFRMPWRRPQKGRGL